MTKRSYNRTAPSASEKRKDVTEHLLVCGEVGSYGSQLVRAVKRTEHVCFDCCFGQGSCTLVKCKGARPSEDVAFRLLDKNYRFKNTFID